MKVEFASIFLKDLKSIPDKKILSSFKEIVLVLESAENLDDIRNIKKLAGVKSTYRIRVKDYRAGFYIINNVILFKRFLHRKDIYKYFP